MNTKKICVIANGYAEEMMAAQLMSEIRVVLEKKKLLNEYQFVGGSLVSSGKWYHAELFPTFFSGGMTPSGGFPTRSLSGFFADFGAGAFLAPFKFNKMITEWSKYNLETIVVVGDFLLMMLASSAVKKNKVPLVFIPTAKSDYIQSHYKIEKKYIQKYATISFPRDQATADDFTVFGITALYCGNMMQDLLDLHTNPLATDEEVIALLPGSREESYGNLGLMLTLISQVKHKIHWAFVQAASLDPEKIRSIFEAEKWIFLGLEDDIPLWQKGDHKVYCYPNPLFGQVIVSCIFGISLAGTGSEQIAGLGKPVVGFVGMGPQSTSRRMDDNQKLLGEAFYYAQKYPSEVLDTINRWIENPEERRKRGLVGLERMGERGATAKMADYIVNRILCSFQKPKGIN